MVEATRNGCEMGTERVIYTVLFVREFRRDGDRIVETIETGINGTFSDCCRDKRSLIPPKGYEVALRRISHPSVP